MMKKIVSHLLTLAIIGNLMLLGIPSQSVYAENEMLIEEKIYSNATIDDEFADNRVLVVMNNQASLQFNQYGNGDFDEISCKSVSNLSAATEVKVKAESACFDTNHSVRSRNIRINTFNKILCIELENTGKENVLRAIQELQKRDDIIYAGPDYVIKIDSTVPNDEKYDEQWASEKIKLPQAWDITTGSNLVTVGVLDTGIDGTHPDLADNININLSRDFVTDSAEPVAVDANGHGTHVAGIIGARGNNNEGVSGVCWSVQLISLRILDENGSGYSSDVIEAIEYAERQGIQILNFSGGGYEEDNGALYEKIEEYSGLFVCAAGNDNKDIDVEYFYPGCYSLDLVNLISVGASDEDDKRWFWYDEPDGASNYGSTTVDLFAPGEYIYSTYPNSAYATSTGSSMATPYVTGVAALLLSKYPTLTPCEIKDTILSNVDECGTTFYDLCFSGGRLNAYKALTNVMRHPVTYTSIDSQKHHRICTTHNTFQTLQHNFSYQSNGIEGGHTCTCNQCSYVCSESHTWVTAGLKIRCSKCGVITTHAPVTPFMLPPQLLAQIEQMGYVGNFAMDIGDGTVLCRVGNQYYLVCGQTEDTALSYLQNELSVVAPDLDAA